jgi:hypothetical protein
MFRWVFLVAMGMAFVAPADATGKPPVIPPQLVAKIDSLIATRKHNRIVIQATGAVDSGGWSDARLRPVKPDPADEGTIVVQFIATPPGPDHVVIQGLLPIAADATVRMRRGAVSVRAISGTNEITTQILK